MQSIITVGRNNYTIHACWQNCILIWTGVHSHAYPNRYSMRICVKVQWWMCISSYKIKYTFSESSQNPKLCTNLKIMQPILKLHTDRFVQSPDCESTICWRNGLRVRASELTNGRELRALQVGEALNRGSPPVWGLSVPVPRLRGREFLWVGDPPRCPWHGGLDYMTNVDGNSVAARAP